MKKQKLTKEELKKLAKFFELLIEIDHKNKVKSSLTSTNSNSRN